MAFPLVHKRHEQVHKKKKKIRLADSTFEICLLRSMSVQSSKINFHFTYLVKCVWLAVKAPYFFSIISTLPKQKKSTQSTHEHLGELEKKSLLKEENYLNGN